MARHKTRGRKLNLGCGNFPMQGFLNVDRMWSTRPELICDLDRCPYPFSAGQFDEIHASHVLEHLSDPLLAMREWHRILRPEGRLTIKVPHFSRGFTNPDHKRGFDVSFPLYFNPDMPPWYSGTTFELEKLELHWDAQPYLKHYVTARWVAATASALGKVVDTVANLHPMLFSRLFTFWVGGFEEVEFVFRRPGRTASGQVRAV